MSDSLRFLKNFSPNISFFKATCPYWEFQCDKFNIGRNISLFFPYFAFLNYVVMWTSRAGINRFGGKCVPSQVGAGVLGMREAVHEWSWWVETCSVGRSVMRLCVPPSFARPPTRNNTMSNLLLLQKSHSVFVSRHLCEHLWERFQEVGITVKEYLYFKLQYIIKLLSKEITSVIPPATPVFLFVFWRSSNFIFAKPRGVINVGSPPTCNMHFLLYNSFCRRCLYLFFFALFWGGC